MKPMLPHLLRWRLALGVLLLMALLPALAAPPLAPPVPLLWKVSAGDRHLYLLGSFHLLRPADYPLSDDVERAFAAADRLVFELPADDVGSPELAARMAAAGRQPPGRLLQADLDAATWTRLQAYAAGHGLPLQSLQGYKPWFVGLSISVQDMGRQGLQADLGLDRQLMARAQQGGKPVLGLESAQAQIAMLDAMAPDEQRQMLAEALDDAGDSAGGEVLRLHDAWRSGDARLLWTQMAQQMRQQYPALYRSINVERNQRWTPQLERMLREQPPHGRTLVVVGALHLLGDDGVVERLRARGLTVERICSACAAPTPR
jgi:uncharacterized protein